MQPLSIRLEFTSTFEMITFVEVVGGHVSREIGLDEDQTHWVSVAIRECVINAIKHGNQHDTAKRVFVEFATIDAPRAMTIRVRDEGRGFDPEEVADPLAPENLLKGSGRGIFLIRNFMDDVRLQRLPDGGMEISMMKRATAASDAPGAERH
ncbi:MAG: ATP-binding protein [Acidobacteriaceae bacterium]|nr:ATP-binding protein [Acidobacteriaceae bacterium]